MGALRDSTFTDPTLALLDWLITSGVPGPVLITDEPITESQYQSWLEETDKALERSMESWTPEKTDS